MQELNRMTRECRVGAAVLLLCFSLFIFSCKKKTEYVYAVNDETISEAGVQKPNVKSNTEFISIAYTDVMGATVSSDNLNQLKTQYIAFGDKGVTEDLIIRNFMNKTGNQIPTSIPSDKKTFVTDAYKKIYNRMPNEYEIYYLNDLLTKNSSITAEMFYYALMTSNEYRQF